MNLQDILTKNAAATNFHETVFLIFVGVSLCITSKKGMHKLMEPKYIVKICIILIVLIILVLIFRSQLVDFVAFLLKHFQETTLTYYRH